MEFRYIITLAAAAAAAPHGIADLDSLPTRLPELNATEHCRNRNMILNTIVGNELQFSSSFHLSIALSGSLLLIVSLLRVKQYGYTLSRRWYRSTDDLMWLFMGFIVLIWSIFVPISTLAWDDCEGLYHLQTPTEWQGYQFWGRMAFVPWLLDGVFLWWAFERFVFFSCRAGKGQYSNSVDVGPFVSPNGLISLFQSNDIGANCYSSYCL